MVIVKKYTPNKTKSFVPLPEFARLKEVELEDGTIAVKGDGYPVVLQDKRDPDVWKRDPKVKQAKKETEVSVRGQNYLIEQLIVSLDHLTYDLHLTVGKTRL
jgi:hypothetical protein